MNLLAIDTSTEACSAALIVDHEILERYVVAPQQHGKLLLPMVDELLSDAGLTLNSMDGLAFGQGPGSFTGVRIAAAAIQAMALSTDCGVVGVSALQALAHRAWREFKVPQCIAAIDARMQQVYWGHYRSVGIGATHLLGEEQVSNPDQLKFCRDAVKEANDGADMSLAGVGSGASRYCDELQQLGIQCENELGALFPSALDIVYLAQTRFVEGDAVSAEQAIPVYLRDKVALTAVEQAASKSTSQD